VYLIISGKQRAGKDISADYITKRLYSAYPEMHIKRLAFADPIVDIERYTQTRLDLPVEKNRAFRVMLGAWARDIESGIFINTLETSLHLHDNVIVTDGRYPNEIDRLKAKGFYSIRIVANESVRITRGADEAFLKDASEMALDEYEAKGKFNEIIVNEDSLDYLYARLDEVIARIEVRLLTGSV